MRRSRQYKRTEKRSKEKNKATEYLVLSCLLLAILGWIAVRKPPYGLPPGPRPLPLMGNLLQLGKLPHRALAKLARRHGPIMSLQLGLVPYVVVSSPSVAKQVLQKHDRVLSHRAPPDALRALNHDKLSMGLLPPEAAWRNLRKICNSLVFATLRLDASQGLRSRKVGELVSFLTKSALAEEPVDIGRSAFTTTLNLISNTIFSKDTVKYDERASAEFKDAIRNLMVESGSPNISDYFPILERLDLQGCRRRVTFHLRKMNDIFDKKIEDRETLRASNGSSEPQDFLQVLHDAMAAGDLDRPAAGALISDLFNAGSDTSSTTIEWAMAELLRNPTAMERVRSEVAEAMKGSGREAVEESDTGRMPLLQAVVKETLRLQPPAPLLLPRRAAEAVHLAVEDNNSLYAIPKGTRILVNAWAIGRDPSVWGSDAAVFRPERFASGDFLNVDYTGRHMELIPFGAGRRICPGLPLASRMVHLILAKLLWCFDWKLPKGMDPTHISMTENFGITMSKAEPLLAVPVIARNKVVGLVFKNTWVKPDRHPDHGQT